MTSIRYSFIGLMLLTAGWLLVPTTATAAEDNREWVKLPPMMQEHMLASMRDHLSALNDMLGALAEGDINQAAAIAEQRLGMSSMAMHGASHLSKFMPEAMSTFGTDMHHAASRFLIVAQDAELNPSKESQHDVYKALQDITNSCNGCHQSYRIR